MNQIMNRQTINKTLLNHSMPRRQRGAMTLLISLVILTLITFVSLYTARTVSMEQKIAGNEFRSRQAFEAAEAGLEATLAYVNPDNGGPDRDDNDTLDANVLCTAACAGSDGGAAPVDIQGDTSSMILANGSTVTVTVVDISEDSDMTQILVTSVGTSSDGTASRTISLIVPTVTPLPNVPDNPMTTRGSMVIGGSATVYNPEGASTIWSGDNVDLGSNNSTATNIADPGDGNYPTCLGGTVICDTVRTSDKTTMGLDVIENDASLSSLNSTEFFENFFGSSPTEYRNSMVTMDVNSGTIASIDETKNEVIWAEGDVTIGGLDVGCDTSISNKTAYNTVTCANANRGPVILIVNGNLTLTGGKFLGLVFVTGNISLSGNTYIEGAIVVGGSASSSGGSLDVWYNSSYLKATNVSGPKGGAAGTWRDF